RSAGLPARSSAAAANGNSATSKTAMLLRKVIVLGVPISAFPFLVRSGLDPAARAEMIACRRAEKMAMHGRFDKASPDGLAVRARAGGQPPKDRPRSRTVGNSAE